MVGRGRAFPADRSRRRRPAERIEVGALDDATIEELLASALGGPVDAATVRELADHSRGNPMFLRELVSGALRLGASSTRGACGVLPGSCPPRSDWPSWWRCAWATSTSRAGPVGRSAHGRFPRRKRSYH